VRGGPGLIAKRPKFIRPPADIHEQRSTGGSMYTKQSYVQELKAILPRYKQDNAWVYWWAKDSAVNALRGWLMYEKAAQNALGFLLLGDTAIRSNKLLLLNFGLASAHGVQEAKDLAMIQQIMGERVAVAAPGTTAQELLGPGSILSDKEWTPLLNDSFILGGINACQEFHLAEDGFHAFNPPPRPVAPPSLVAERRAMFGEVAKFAAPDPAKDKWKAYLQATPTVFWGGALPRVFAREILGLKAFGYKPVFAMQELGFVCVDRNKAMGATFTDYLNVLRAVNFQDRDKTAIMGAISEYLFGAKGVLT
jgi:hypothetical protein